MVTNAIVTRVSPDERYRIDYHFELSGKTLSYIGYMEYHRDEGDLWPDDPNYPKALNFGDWCRENGLDPDDYCEYNSVVTCGCCFPVFWRYREYERTFNPITSKTSYGKSRQRGSFGGLISNRDKQCPDDVAADAIQALIKDVKVVWK